MTSSTCSATCRLRPARSGLVVALLFATAGAAWGSDGAKAAQPVNARIDASKTRAPISKYVYGQFIEHIAGIINTGLWAEMLDDRKFLQPIAAPPSPAPPPRGRFGALRRWSPVGPADSITMDMDRPYVGDHSPLVKLNGAEPRGIRQAGLAVRRGKSYSGRIVLAGTPNARVTVSLVWAEGAEARQASVVGTLSATYQTFPLRFTALADSDDARLEITGTGQDAFHVGAVSLMPADNLEGFRPEVIAALKQLRSGVYRFPGGNFVSAHEWRDAIGERDRRPPVMDPVWNAIQPNDVGTDEFMTLCRLLEVEPYITVNAGFGDAWSAAQYVEYTNGAVSTPMGRLRAANGHPEPYGVRFWGIGNEAWGDWQFGATSLAQFVVKHNVFAKAMKRVDPTIQLVASGAMPDAMTGSKQSQRISGKVIPDPLSAADWTGGLLLHCLENTDLISEHFYSYANRRFDLAKGDSVALDAGEPLVDWMRRPANHVRAKVEAYQDYLERIPALKAKPVPINLDEWAYSGVPPNSYKVVPAYAWTFHEMFRHSDLYQMAGFTFATSLLSADRSRAVLNPAGLLFQLYRDRFGTIPVEVTGNSPQPPPKYPAGGEEPRVNAGSDTFPLDVVAAWTADHRTLTIAVINPTESVQRLELAIAGAELAGTGRLWRMAPADLNATIVVGQRPGVAIEELALDAVPSAPSFAPFSVNVYAFPVREGRATPYLFQNPDLPMEDRISDLIGRMTLEEKIDALATRASVARLGVVGSPHIEGYHGVAQGGPSNWGRRNPTATTQFPQAYGLGSTWDPELVRRVAAQEAQEARYLFQSKKYQRSGLIVRAPNADLARDPRWGRTEEVYGEDAFHAGTLATAFTRGLQGDDPRYWKTAALLKHFLANSNEDAREHSSSNFDERLWREYYAKPFEMAVRQGGSRAMMAAYNAVNGTPAHVHPMLKDIVVREWGLDGILCTDGGGLRLLVTDHKAFADLPAAAAACMRAGINHFLDRQKEPVTEAVQKGLLSEAQIDEALRGLFRVSIRLGLLDPAERVPYATIGADGDPEPWSQPATHSLVREVTRKSIVLLKNSANLLPLNRAKVKSIAVVGPLANTVLLDWYSGTPPYAVSPREGIERVAPRPGGGPGVNWVGDMSQAAIDTARSRDVAVVCVGTHPESNAGWNIVTSPSEGKEGVDRKEITLPHGQEEFVQRVIAANPNTVVVLIASYPVALPWAARNATTILHMTHASQELGNALADVLFGDTNPSGRLAQTWPSSVDQLPPMMDYDLRHGRTYMYSQAEPQYPFGFGLSYTRFSYGNLRTSTGNLRGGATLDVSVDVTNAGQRAGDEVVQLYVRYPGSNVERPRKQLRGFARVALAPGETKTVTLGLAAADLAYWDAARHAWVVEPGLVELMVGPSSADADLKLRRIVSVGP